MQCPLYWEEPQRTRSSWKIHGFHGATHEGLKYNIPGSLTCRVNFSASSYQSIKHMGETGLNQCHGKLSRAHSPTALVWLFRFSQPWNTKVVSNNQKKGLYKLFNFNLGLWQCNMFCPKPVSQTLWLCSYEKLQLHKKSHGWKHFSSTTSFFQKSIDWQCVTATSPFLQHWQLIRHHWPVEVIQIKHLLLSHAKNCRLTIHNLCKSTIHLYSVCLGVWPSNFNVYCLSNTLPVDPSGSYLSNSARTRSRFNTNDAATVGLSISDTLPVLSYANPLSFSCVLLSEMFFECTTPRSTHYNTGQAWSMPSLAVRDLQLNLNSWLDWKPENSHVLANCNYFFWDVFFFTPILQTKTNMAGSSIRTLQKTNPRGPSLSFIETSPWTPLRDRLGPAQGLFCLGRICLATCWRSSQNRDFRDINESFPRYFRVPSLKSITYIPIYSHETI